MTTADHRIAALEAELSQARDQIRTSAAELEAEKDRAATAEAAKAKFLATLSHELRTPLNAIIGFSELMEGEMLGPLGNDQYKIYLKDIHDSGRHLLSLVDDLLSVSRSQAGQLEMVDAEVETSDLLESVARLLGPEARKNQVRIDVRLAPNLGMIFGDERALRQVLINILGNAVRYSDANGHVVLTARETAEGGMEVVVSDNGIGIAADKLKRVFEPFFQGSDTLSRTHEGAGLGLAIARSITEQHDGQISIKSEEGVGTSVTVSLPSSRVIDDADYMDQTQFDDDEDVDMSVCLTLDHEGRRITVYQDGGEFIIGRPDPRKPDLICDIPLQNPKVSRPHARIVHSNGQFFLIDQSRGGCWVARDGHQTEYVHQNASAALDERGAIHLVAAPGSQESVRISFAIGASDCSEQPEMTSFQAAS